MDIRALFHGMAIKEQRVLKGLRKAYGNRVYLAGLRTLAGELLILQNLPDLHNWVDFV